MRRSALPAVLAAALVPHLAGCGGKPAFTKPMVLGGETVSARSLNRGRKVYEIYCFSCHGLKGDGRGPAAIGLRPLERQRERASSKSLRTGAGPAEASASSAAARSIPASSRLSRSVPARPAWTRS